MEIVRISEVEWVPKPTSGVDVGRSPLLPGNDHADIVYARIPVGGELYKHFHTRPTEAGFTTCFLFSGGHVELLLAEDVSRQYQFAEPVHLTFYSGEVHGIRNLGETDLLMEVVCAPRFQDDEETRVDAGEK